MAPTVVLITGIGRGIAKAIATAYLARPNFTVIGSVRDAKAPKNQELTKLPVASGSKLLLVSIENDSATDPKKAVQEIQAAGIDHLDIVISSSAISPAPAPLTAVDPKDLTDAFKINTVSTVLLYQAVHEMLAKSSNPKWISVNTRIASIGQAEAWYFWAGAYGISKAAQNWFTATLHKSQESLTAFAIYPGFVRTDMGVSAAKAGGIPEPTTTPEESAEKILGYIDKATRDTLGGKFFDVITGENFLY